MATTLLQYDASSFDGDTVPYTASDKAAYFDSVNGRLVVVFPAAGTDEYAAVTKAVEMPQAYAVGALTAKIGYFTNGTANGIVFEVEVEAVTDGDTTDLDTGSLFDTANASGTITIPGTAGYIDVISVTLTNKDSVAAGDMVRFRVRRDNDAAGDDSTADVYVLWLAIQE